jgi:hypothetical protein
MPAHAGTWISDGGRARRLLTEELAKGLGVPKSWGDLELLDPQPLGWQTCSHIYEGLGNVLATADAHIEDDNANDADDGGTAGFTDGARPQATFSSKSGPSDPLPVWTWEAVCTRLRIFCWKYNNQSSRRSLSLFKASPKPDTRNVGT